MDIPKWRVLSSTTVVDSRYFRLRKDAIELPNGTQIDDYYVREGRGFSVVFALTDDGRVVMVRQFKYGIGRLVLELPAGFIDDGEDPRRCAERELAEETGYVAKSMEYVRSFATEPSNSGVQMHVFLARGARQAVAQQLDPTEAIEVELHTIQELRDRIAGGEIEVAPQVAAIYYVLQNCNVAPAS
jgi:8-oxo-dGTP pyrophosphatase MutT (NUDIX family)